MTIGAVTSSTSTSSSQSLNMQDFLKVLPAHVLHIDNYLAIDAVDAVYAHDVGMPKAIHHARLFQKSAQISRLNIDLF